MIQDFKTYTGEETLEKDGFQVYKNTKVKNILREFGKDLEVIAQYFHSKEVFRTKLGDIKQIQNLHKYWPDKVKNLNEYLASLVGVKKYEILNNQYFCKPPNYKMTSAHQDNAYFESKENVVTFWIPFQGVDLVNSCMFYVPGSHKKGLVEHKAIGTNVRTRTGKTGFSLYSEYYKNKEFIKVPMEYGEVLVHDKDCMHFSSANQSDEYRISLTCIMKIIE